MLPRNREPSMDAKIAIFPSLLALIPYSLLPNKATRKIQLKREGVSHREMEGSAEGTSYPGTSRPWCGGQMIADGMFHPQERKAAMVLTIAGSPWVAVFDDSTRRPTGET